MTEGAEPAGCCVPSREKSSGARTTRIRAAERNETSMIYIEGGEFAMGSSDRWAYPNDGEGPVKRVSVDSFWMDASAVTNREFAEFAEDTGYTTEAERIGWSFVFAGLLPDQFPDTRGVANAPWWRQVYGADWQQPEGPHSSAEDRTNHPVLHVSWTDAVAYCQWADGRLPTEAEWEFAARGGLEGGVFPWGDELEPDGEHRMNVWQGSFPDDNTLADGFLGTCEVDEFPPNGYGLFNMTGNVWEWAADWFDRDFRTQDVGQNPTGPARGTHKLQKGGSYLCHHSYCHRYRVAARIANTPDSSTGNVGFRCVRSP